MDKILHKFEKNATEEVRIGLTEFKGKELLSIRVFYDPLDGTEWKPTKNGITLSIDKADDLITGIKKLEETISGTKTK